MAYQRLSTEEKEQRKKELMQKVENIIDNFQRSPADLIEYLKFNSKFYQYSKNNNTLIYQQNRYAQYCGSFKHFKDMGYSVKKGEHGIKILVPYISKYFYNADTEEWKKVSEASAEQKQKIKNGEMEIKQYTSFGVGTVFDISQTDCPVEDYPKFFGFGHESKSHRELFNAVKYYAEGKGIPVEIVDLKSITLSGQYNAIDNSIELSDKLNDDRLLSVMTHELSHALLHNSALLENNDKHIMQIEFEADALSLLLRERLGISDIEDARQAHLQASFKQYMEWVEANQSEQHCPTLSEILDNINETYSNMVEDFDNSISHYFELHPDIEKSANNFSQTIDDFINGKINPYAQIFVCKTTQAMLACGAKDLDVIINQSTLRKIMSDDVNKYKHPHNLDEKIIKSIPEELSNPIMILNGSEPSSIVLISNLTDKSNQNIIISCKLNSEKSMYEVNEITSVYPKNNITNYINNQLSNKKLIGCNKKRANRLLKSLGLQSSEVEASIDYTDIIPSSDKNVNNQISENSVNNYFNDSIHEINNRLSSEVIAHLQMFVDSDLQIYGKIQESTLNAINMQGYKYVNGNFEKEMMSQSHTPGMHFENQEQFDNYTQFKNVRYHFYNCTFDDIHFSENVVIGQLERCRFNRCTFENFDAEDICFNNSVLTQCRIINCNLKSCNFESIGLYQSQISKSNFTNANFAAADIKQTRFDENNLSAIKLHGALLNGVHITKSTINNPVEGLYIENITWGGATPQEIEVNRNRIFSELKLEPVSFEQSIEQLKESQKPLSLKEQNSAELNGKQIQFKILPANSVAEYPYNVQVHFKYNFTAEFVYSGMGRFCKNLDEVNKYINRIKREYSEYEYKFSYEGVNENEILKLQSELENTTSSLEPLAEMQKHMEPITKQTVVVNCFAGPGAGKTTCAWEIASELKKRGIEAEYVGEYAKELVWDGNAELLDGSLQSQQQLYDVQNHRVQRLLGKVDAVVTDSPAILGAMYLKQPDEAFENKIINDFKQQHNFNLFINRGNTFQQTGRIHNFEESKAIDNNIKSFLEKYNIYYGTYEHSTIDKVVNNIEVHLKKINHKLPLSNNKAQNDNLTFNDDSQMYSESDSDELNNLFKISVKLNEQNLQPIDVLQDKKLIDFYSFSCNINNSETVKELLWKIQQNDMQTVAIMPSENGYILNCIGKDFTIYPFNNIVYETNEKALSEVFKNNQIAKLVEPSVPESCNAYKDLSILSEADNLKYPFIQVLWSDTEQLKDSDCISLNTAQEKFDLANQAAGDNQQNTSFSLHLSGSEIYNFKYNHSLQGQEILEYIKSHLQEAQSDQALNKSLTTLNSYINSQTANQKHLNQQSIKTLDSFDATEYPL